MLLRIICYKEVGALYPEQARKSDRPKNGGTLDSFCTDLFKCFSLAGLIVVWFLPQDTEVNNKMEIEDVSSLCHQIMTWI